MATPYAKWTTILNICSAVGAIGTVFGEMGALQPSRLCVMVSSSSPIYNGSLHSEDELNWCCGYFLGIPLVCELCSLVSCCFSTYPHCWVPGGVCQGHKDDCDLLHTSRQMLVSPKIWTVEFYCACVLVLWCFFFLFATYIIGVVIFTLYDLLFN